MAAGTRVWYQPTDGVRFAGVVVNHGGGMHFVLMCLSYALWKRRTMGHGVVVTTEGRLSARDEDSEVDSHA